MSSVNEFDVKVKFNQKHLAGVIFGSIVMIIDFVFFMSSPIFLAGIIIAACIMLFPYWIEFLMELQRQKQMEVHFPDFVRNFVGAIKSGMPLGKAIIYVSDSDYGSLTPYVKKMAHQLEWNIPVHKVLKNFTKDVNNPVVTRALNTVIKAERSGGNIEDVLGSVTSSLLTIKKIKQERKAAIQSQVTQSYVIFFIFLAVLVTIQNLLIPYIASMGQDDASTDIAGGSGFENLQKPVRIQFSSIPAFIRSIFAWFGSLTGIFSVLALFQSFFTGIILGKFAEGTYKSGLRHSVTMMVIALLIMSVANALLANNAVFG